MLAGLLLCVRDHVVVFCVFLVVFLCFCVDSFSPFCSLYYSVTRPFTPVHKTGRSTVVPGLPFSLSGRCLANSVEHYPLIAAAAAVALVSWVVSVAYLHSSAVSRLVSRRNRESIYFAAKTILTLVSARFLPGRECWSKRDN